MGFELMDADSNPAIAFMEQTTDGESGLLGKQIVCKSIWVRARSFHLSTIKLTTIK